MPQDDRLEVKKPGKRFKTASERAAFKLGYMRPEDLIHHFPRRHEDRAKWGDPLKTEPGSMITVRGKIINPKLTRWRGGCRFSIELHLHGTFQTLKLVWFGIPYLIKSLTAQRELIAYGKLTENKGIRLIQQPEFELITDGDETIHLNRITPIYPTTEGISQRQLRSTIFEIISKIDLPEKELHPVPEGFISRKQALLGIHFPDSFEQLEQARNRLVFDEWFQMQLLVAVRQKNIVQIIKPRSKHAQNLLEKFLTQLPFQPTKAQKKVCNEIDQDLAQPHPMNRLLQGDVGSGKTFVAIHALLRTLEQNQNGALLAPTQILAEQHALNLKKWLDPLNIRVELWTRTKQPDLESGLFKNNGVVFVGTHALIQEGVELPNLGMGVIDEQHKFGVMQRASFLQKGSHPDLLVMTATPIPRTLSLTLYGDLDVSILDEMPPGRGVLKTALRSEEQLPKIFEFIKKEFDAGRQAYVVYPLVEESDKLDVKSVQRAFEKLRHEFSGYRVEMLHGRMDADKKESIMSDFRDGKINLLAATTVIEVGVDVPNATIMLIENAERFGLAQLHQLRGRVGRGKHTSYCILIGKESQQESWQRLKVLEQTLDGFKIAEEDFNLRGPGDIFGTAQTGFPPLKIANVHRDFDLLAQARVHARNWLKSEPEKALQLSQEFSKTLMGSNAHVGN
jgi:ATP-dependent DNA helicase RecG